MIPRTRFYPALLVLSVSALLFGCGRGGQPESLSIPRLMIESRGVDYGSLAGDVVTLPVSGTSITIQREPLVNEFDIVNVELVKVEIGLALLIQVSEKGARNLYRGSITNMGGRIVFTVNGNAIGARRIDSALRDANFYTFVELPDDELGQLVLDLKASIAELQAGKGE